MEDKEFRFQGIDARTELKLSALLVIPACCIMCGTLYLAYQFRPDPLYSPIILGAVLTVAGSMMILKFMVGQIKEMDRIWTIKVKDLERITVTFKDQVHHFGLMDITNVKNMGNTNVRYLTINTKELTLRIRVGSGGFAPFSSERDIMILDTFISYIMPYLTEHFHLKKLKNAMHPRIIPNFGVYVRKGEKIKYSLINKMYPWQVIAMIVFIGIIMMIIFMIIMEHYF